MKEYIIGVAAKAARDGENPAKAIYSLSKEKFGYAKVETKESAPKKDLKKIDANRRKSASPLQAGGRSGSVSLTKESAADMSLAEFAKLTNAQLREIEGMEYL